MRPSLNPDRRVGADAASARSSLASRLCPSRDAGDAPSIVPYAGLPGHLSACIVLQHGEPLGEEPLGIGWLVGAARRGPRLEQDDSIPRIHGPEVLRARRSASA